MVGRTPVFGGGAWLVLATSFAPCHISRGGRVINPTQKAVWSPTCIHFNSYQARFLTGASLLVPLSFMAYYWPPMLDPASPIPWLFIFFRLKSFKAIFPKR